MFSLLQPYHLLESENGLFNTIIPSLKLTLSPLKMGPPWKFGDSYWKAPFFRCYTVSFREGMLRGRKLTGPDPPKKGHPVTRFKHEVSEELGIPLEPEPLCLDPVCQGGSVRGVTLRYGRFGFLLVGYRAG